MINEWWTILYFILSNLKDHFSLQNWWKICDFNVDFLKIFWGHSPQAPILGRGYGALRTTRLTYVCSDFRSWPCMTGWTWALTVSAKMRPMNCDFRAYEVCTNFHRGLLQRGRRTGVEPLKLVITHIRRHHLSDILRCVVVCNVYYYESS